MCARSLDDGLVNVLRRSSARYAEDRLALRRRTRTVGMSRTMRRGSRAHRTRARECGHKLGNAAGVRPIRLHDARHSCGTALHLRGVPLAVIAKWLGHADASITARLYTYSQGEALRDAGNSLGGVDILVTLRPSGELIAPSPIHVSAGQRRFQRVPPAGFEPVAFCSGDPKPTVCPGQRFPPDPGGLRLCPDRSLLGGEWVTRGSLWGSAKCGFTCADDA